MSNTKFTPAPWYTKSGKTYCCIRVDDRVIADMRTVNAVYDEHNAHLIAAAPEMYAFIESLQLDVERDIQRDELLAKARGEK